MQSDEKRLAENIYKQVRREFAKKHMSGNLAKTMHFHKTNNGYVVTIPAEIYNMYQYQMHGVIIPTGKGSYASRLDKEGSKFFIYDKKGGRRWIEPKNHIGYVDESIRKAINITFKRKKRVEWR